MAYLAVASVTTKKSLIASTPCRRCRRRRFRRRRRSRRPVLGEKRRVVTDLHVGENGFLKRP